MEDENYWQTLVSTTNKQGQYMHDSLQEYWNSNPDVDVYIDYEKAQKVSDTLNLISRVEVENARTIIVDAINQFNNVKGMAELVGTLDCGYADEAADLARDYIQTLVSDLDSKVAEIKSYDQGNWWDNFKSGVSIHWNAAKKLGKNLVDITWTYVKDLWQGGIGKYGKTVKDFWTGVTGAYGEYYDSVADAIRVITQGTGVEFIGKAYSLPYKALSILSEKLVEDTDSTYEEAKVKIDEFCDYVEEKTGIDLKNLFSNDSEKTRSPEKIFADTFISMIADIKRFADGKEASEEIDRGVAGAVTVGLGNASVLGAVVTADTGIMNEEPEITDGEVLDQNPTVKTETPDTKTYYAGNAGSSIPQVPTENTTQETMVQVKATSTDYGSTVDTGYKDITQRVVEKTQEEEIKTEVPITDKRDVSVLEPTIKQEPKEEETIPKKEEKMVHTGGSYTEEGYQSDEAKDTKIASITDIIKMPEDLTVEEIIKGNKYTRVPTTNKPIVVPKGKTTSIIPVATGVGVAAASAIGAKMYHDYKERKRKEEEEEDREEFNDYVDIQDIPEKSLAEEQFDLMDEEIEEVIPEFEDVDDIEFDQYSDDYDYDEYYHDAEVAYPSQLEELEEF